MAVAVHAMRRARARAGQEVVVIGTGGIGAFLTYALSRAGVHVVAVDVLADRLAVARKLGAAATLDVGDPPGLRAALTGLGVAPTLVFEVTGHEAGVAAAIASVEPGGRIVTVGIPKHNLALDTRRVTTKELEIVGTNALVASEDVPEAARLLGLNHAVWSSVAPVAIPLERVVEDGLIPMIEGRATRIKTLVDPWISAERPTTMTDFARSAASHESATP
jgi:threonine dehydrogenase-like Zn-dependent dehydrogenase